MIALFGWRIHEALLGLVGFIIGGIIGGIFGAILANSQSGLVFLFGIGGFLLGGVAGWKLILIYERISVGLLAGLSGAILIGQLTRQVTITQTPWMPQFGLYMPNVQTTYNYPAILFGFVAFAIIGWLFYKIAWIFGTSALGAGIVALSVVFLSPDSAGAAGVIMFLVGLVVQGQEFAKKNNTTLTKEVEKFIQSPRLPGGAAAPSQNASADSGTNTPDGLTVVSGNVNKTLKSFQPFLEQYFGKHYTLTLAVGMLCYAISALLFLTLSNPLIIGSIIFLLVAYVAVDRLKREQFNEARSLVLIAGIFGLVFGLLIGGACFLYVYGEMQARNKTASSVPST